nr:MAG TPA: hypothetical protein [Caudoviricetes sp.]
MGARREPRPRVVIRLVFQLIEATNQLGSLLRLV